ncbi:MAG: hypothetical protein OES69_19420 [Myxococcales bacterium]|nr:hypothetical protein [Myxococcales bacterium]MDH3846118.1 hypothetical protein [Myxococcales bacterium]
MTRITVALGAALVAYLITAALARSWRKHGRQFTLRIGPQATAVFDEAGREVFTTLSLISYRRTDRGIELTAVGGEVSGQQDVTKKFDELHGVPRNDAVSLFGGFAQFCLVRARQVAKVPVWRYATLGFEIDERLPILEIATEACHTRALRNATREVTISSGRPGPG